MIREEEPYFCYNISLRRAAGLVGIVTMFFAIALIVRSANGIIELENGGESLCKPIKNHLISSCSQILKTAWAMAIMLVIDSTLVFSTSFLLICGVVKKMAWLMVPYMMWVKMTLSIHCVTCIFLITNYRTSIVGSDIIINIILIVIHCFFSQVVRQYDDQLMKKLFSSSEGIAAG